MLSCRTGNFHIAMDECVCRRVLHQRTSEGPLVRDPQDGGWAQERSNCLSITGHGRASGGISYGALLFSARYRPVLATCLAAPHQRDGAVRDGHLRMHGAFGSAVDALRRNREANRCSWQNRRSLALRSLFGWTLFTLASRLAATVTTGMGGVPMMPRLRLENRWAITRENPRN